MLTDEQIDILAKELAESFDYPWEYMPEQGRNGFRQKVKKIASEARREALEEAKKSCALIEYNGVDKHARHAAMDCRYAIEKLIKQK